MCLYKFSSQIQMSRATSCLSSARKPSVQMLALKQHSRLKCSCWPPNTVWIIVLPTEKKLAYHESWRMFFNMFISGKFLPLSGNIQPARGLEAQIPIFQSYIQEFAKSSFQRRHSVVCLSMNFTTVQSLLSSTEVLQGHDGIQWSTYLQAESLIFISKQPFQNFFHIHTIMENMQ